MLKLKRKKVRNSKCCYDKKKTSQQTKANDIFHAKEI